MIHFSKGISLLILPEDDTNKARNSWDLVYEERKRISYDSTGAVGESEDETFAHEVPVMETMDYSIESASVPAVSHGTPPPVAVGGSSSDFKDRDALITRGSGILSGNRCFAARIAISLSLYLHFDEPILLKWPKSRRKRLWGNTYLATNRSNWLLFSSDQRVLASSLGSGYGLDQIYLLEGKTIEDVQVISGGAAIHFTEGVSLFIIPYDERNEDDISWDLVYGGQGALTAQKVIGFYSDGSVGENDVLVPDIVNTPADDSPNE